MTSREFCNPLLATGDPDPVEPDLYPYGVPQVTPFPDGDPQIEPQEHEGFQARGLLAGTTTYPFVEPLLKGWGAEAVIARVHEQGARKFVTVWDQQTGAGEGVYPWRLDNMPRFLQEYPRPHAQDFVMALLGADSLRPLLDHPNLGHIQGLESALHRRSWMHDWGTPGELTGSGEIVTRALARSLSPVYLFIPDKLPEDGLPDTIPFEIK